MKPFTTQTQKLVLTLAAVLHLTGTAFAATPASRPAEPASATASPAVTRAMDEMVAELMGGGAGAAPGSKGVGRPSGPVRFDGFAWQSGSGTAGTSAFGLQMNQAVSQSLGARHIDATSGSSVGSKGIGGNILRGGFKLIKGGMSVSLAMVDANTGRVISEARRMLSTQSLTGLAMDNLLPPDAANARQLAQLVTQSLGENNASFHVEVSTDRGPQGAYFENDPLHVFVRTDRDCYVRLYHVSWGDRTLTMIFPNEGDRESFVQAGAVKQVPTPGSTAEFVVSKPYGVDAIIAIASSEPFADDAFVSSQLAGGAADAGAQAAPSESPAQPQQATAEGGDAALGSRGVVRTGPYLAAEKASAARARAILAKGLIVRQTASAQGSSRRTQSAGSSSTPMFQGGETPGAPTGDASGIAPAYGQTSPLTPPAAGATRGEVSKASCYYTTLPKLTLRR